MRRGPAAEAAAALSGRARSPTPAQSMLISSPHERAERHLIAGEGAAACVDTTHHVSHAKKRRAATAPGGGRPRGPVSVPGGVGAGIHGIGAFSRRVIEQIPAKFAGARCLSTDVRSAVETMRR